MGANVSLARAGAWVRQSARALAWILLVGIVIYSLAWVLIMGSLFFAVYSVVGLAVPPQ